VGWVGWNTPQSDVHLPNRLALGDGRAAGGHAEVSGSHSCIDHRDGPEDIQPEARGDFWTVGDVEDTDLGGGFGVPTRSHYTGDSYL
jgi:hypothetical protein